MKPEGSLPHSQVPATCPYPETVRSSPHPHIPLPEDILLNTLFSNTLSLCSSLNVSDQVSHPYKTTGNTVELAGVRVINILSRESGKILLFKSDM
jgi:hypothetical protein